MNNIKNQQGAALFIALIVLAAMTIFGMSMMRNTSVQQNILRNTQLKKTSENAAYTEIKAQIDYIEFTNNQLIRTIIDLDEDVAVDMSTIPLVLGGQIKAERAGFDQTVTVIKTEDHQNTNYRAEGEEVDRRGISVRAEIRSSAVVPNTQTRSDQVQGIEYLLGAST